MKIWKDREGNNLTASEFVSRWKDGIQKVTPLQQAQVSLIGYATVLFGIIWGITFTYGKSWWMFTILVGSFILCALQTLGGLQKYLALKNIEKIAREVHDE